MLERKMHRRNCSVATDAVLSNPDLIAYILKGRIGPSTYFTACLVNKAWYTACRTDETLLRLVALYQGGLTRTIFRRLFALTQCEIKTLPHEVHRRPYVGPYYLYREAAVDCVLADGGLARWRERLAKQPRARWQAPTHHHSFEERMHQRAMRLKGVHS